MNLKPLQKNKIKIYNDKILKNEMKEMKKIKEYVNDDFKRQTYFTELNIEEARTKFRIRTKIIQNLTLRTKKVIEMSYGYVIPVRLL